MQEQHESKESRRPIYMYDPTRDYKLHEEEYKATMAKVFNHGKFINGPEVNELEKELSTYVGTEYCITVGNGTDALQIALMALGVKQGDKVITVSQTWISTAEVISIIGAEPIFVDIEDTTFNINILGLEKALQTTKNVKAIIVVNIYGQMAEYDELNKISQKYHVPVIEDGAQSFGATYKGRKSCSMTLIGTTSFFPTKPLGCYGDGGACFTDNEELAVKMRMIKNHGCKRRFEHECIGMNSRLDTLQAAVLKVKLKYLNEALKQRNKIAAVYTEHLNGLKSIRLPQTIDHNKHVWAQYSILMESKNKRDKMVEELKKEGIHVSIYYPKPLHTQKCFSMDIRLPVTERVCETIINLPLYSELNEEEQSYICESFKKILGT